MNDWTITSRATLCTSSAPRLLSLTAAEEEGAWGRQPVASRASTWFWLTSSTTCPAESPHWNKEEEEEDYTLPHKTRWLTLLRSVSG